MSHDTWFQERSFLTGRSLTFYGSSMGRPRGFDEGDVVRAAAAIFARRPYDAVSVDELVTGLGVHRNSLYKTFGSKRGLYVAALDWYLEHEVRPLLRHIADAAEAAPALARAIDSGASLDLLLMATLEQAPVDPDVAATVGRVWDEFDQAIAPEFSTPLRLALTATVIGLRLRARGGLAQADVDTAAAAIIHRHDKQ